MFQTHCYDSWLGGAARDGGFFKLSQLGGTLPAPLFLFLAGVSFALVTDKLRQKGVSADEIARTTILRGGEIFLLALLFRLQEFLLAMGHAPWTDLLRVDILNVDWASLMMMGVACRIAAAGGRDDPAALAQDERSSRPSPAPPPSQLLPRHCGPPGNRTGARGGWSPISTGCTHSARRNRGCFPLFPWAAFAFAGLAVGSLLLSDWARRNEAAALALAGAGGLRWLRWDSGSMRAPCNSMPSTISGTPVRIFFWSASAWSW